MTESCFTPFKTPVDRALIPDRLNDPFDQLTLEICQIAAAELQEFLIKHDASWIHNFGIDSNKAGPVKGKMFGVLVVLNTANQLGYLATFSGKLADENHHPFFVPSVFDVSSDDYFINRGMEELTAMGVEIKALESETYSAVAGRDLSLLKEKRRNKSHALQQQLFSHYHFLNFKMESQNILTIFLNSKNPIPPSAAGECAAPKLLNYAFTHNMKPLAIAEFWWGQSPKSQIRKHKEFYPACTDKCKPILGFMLSL